MDGFSYNNIFETKGIEYIIIITFLILIIPFWRIINSRSGIKIQVKKALGVLSAEILRIPQGLFYSRNHTWAHLESSGLANVGLDDFLVHITGEVKISILKKQGDFLRKGEIMAEIAQDDKTLKVTSPLSGKIIETNTEIIENPSIINYDPFIKGAIYKLRPTDWIEETSSYYLAYEAIAWSKREIARFRDFMAESVKKYSAETAMLILQDGGELIDNPLSELPGEVWQDFQKSFLN